MLWRRYTLIFKEMKCESLLVLFTFLWRWGRWVCFQNIQTISNFLFLSQASFSGVLTIYAFLFGHHTDWRESWKNIMAVCRVDNNCIHYFHFTSPSLPFIPESSRANESRVVHEAVFHHLSCSDFKLTVIQSIERSVESWWFLLSVLDVAHSDTAQVSRCSLPIGRDLEPCFSACNYWGGHRHMWVISKESGRDT